MSVAVSVVVASVVVFFVTPVTRDRVSMLLLCMLLLLLICFNDGKQEELETRTQQKNEKK